MKLVRICFLAILIPMLSGCAITSDFKVAQGIKDATNVNIVTNSSVSKKGFLEAMKAWLEENNYKYTILPEGSSTKQGWVLTYRGAWSWDLAIYLSSAAIKAYENGALAGEAEYTVHGGSASYNLGKYKKGEGIVRGLMSKLFYGKKGG